MNHACPSCQAEYEAWSSTLEAAGIIGPREPRPVSQRKLAARERLQAYRARNARNRERAADAREIAAYYGRKSA